LCHGARITEKPQQRWMRFVIARRDAFSLCLKVFNDTLLLHRTAGKPFHCCTWRRQPNLE